MNMVEALRRGGSLNELFDYGDLATGKPRKVFAFCTSEKCCGKKSKVKIIVDKSYDNCPNCGYAILWEKENEKRRRKVKSKVA